MTSVIHKYEIEAGNFDLALPADISILSVQVQDRKPYLWMLLPTEIVGETRLLRFQSVPTGVVFDAIGWTHIGTFQLPNENPNVIGLPTTLVFHLFVKGHWFPT